MSLQPGTRLGPYEITAQIGVGGMGEVYRATDTNLKRSVAIKVLPASVAGDADRLARFQREAEVLAALNHPNIAAIYGLERSGITTALVMELVEGPTLADRIAQGAIPIDEALPIAKQIAEALEAAHEQGIIHRDLKPANIKVRPDGTVKVLDFGLAKAMEPVGATSPGLSQSPTITTPAMMTGAGMILGTAAYMSPEQARGRAVDKRADIWAFGAVLFEMLAAQRAFPGEDVTDTLAAVVRSEPQWSLLPKNLSPTLLAFLRRCLQKDLKQRIGDIHDVRLALEGAFESGPLQSAVPLSADRPGRLATLMTGTLVGALLVGAATWFALWPNAPLPTHVSRFPIALSGASMLAVNGADRNLAITPDGFRIVYVGNGGTQLFVRPVDALEPTVVFTGQPRGPFVSPDGQWIGFFDVGNTLKKVALTGGPAVMLAAVDGGSRGATWAADDTIIFATNNAATGLQRIPAAGGTASVLTRRAQAEGDHLWPEVLPGGRAVAFTITPVGLNLANTEGAQIAVLDLQSGMRTDVLRGGSHAQYVPTGHLIYAADGSLFAVPFDPVALRIHGTAAPIVSDVVMTNNGGVDAAVAADGTLVYVRGRLPTSAVPRFLVWVDRRGHEESIDAPPRAYGVVRLSPDGNRAVVDIRDGTNDLWTWDFGRGTLTRLTFDPAPDDNPVWDSDGRRIAFRSVRSGTPDLFWTPADGTGMPERLPGGPKTTGGNGAFPRAMVPDGRSIVIAATTPKGDQDLVRVFFGKEPRLEPLVNTTATESNADVSPDGRWLAYQSDESGEDEIYVRPFPDVNQGRWQISSGGGTRPVWARSGRELFYSDRGGSLVSVTVPIASTFTPGPPVVLFSGARYPNGGFRAYDVSADGQRFLMVKEAGSVEADSAPTNLVVVQHFDEELKRLVPTK